MKHSHIAIVGFGIVLVVAHAAVPQMTRQVQVTGHVQLNRNAQQVYVTGQLQITNPVQATTGQVQCTGKYKGGLQLTDAELKEILRQHAAWVKDGGPYHLDDRKVANDPRRANLCGANLSRAYLIGAHLESVHLDDARLTDARLDGAELSGADLRGAVLFQADLSGAHLNYAHLDNAHLIYSRLIGAHFDNAHLDNADLFDTRLNGADLHGAYLSRADLGLADLADAYLDFDSESSPKISPGIASAVNLQLVKFHDEPAALVDLRKEFKELGLRTQENQLTYAIRRTELQRKREREDAFNARTVEDFVHSWPERAFNTVFFDWTCQYGMSPGRPLLIVAALALIMPLVYIFAQVNPGPNGGIWAVWDEHRIKQVEGTEGKPEQLIDGFPGAKSDYSFLLLAFYFSLLSATRIGWHELNVGTWITRIQPREYSLRATGWVRVVSGIQSLISVYLVALAILTYFGTPFEY